MSGVFLFVLRPSGTPVTDEIRQQFTAAAVRNDLPPLRWTSEGSIAVALGPDEAGLGTGPILTRTRRLTVVGNARLDNREEVLGWTGAPELLRKATDLVVIAQALEAKGVKCVSGVLGDFAFVVWDPSTRDLVAARDALGVKALYYMETPDLFALSSRTLPLSDGDRYDLEYVAHYLVSGYSRSERTMFAGVRAVPAGGTLTWRKGASITERFWSPDSFRTDPHPRVDSTDYVEEFRGLLEEAVRLRIAVRGDAWAQLSGGVDSSSIVCMAQALAARGTVAHGLAGTVTIVESLGSGDEREFSDAVVQKYRLRNEQVTDYWAWQDDGREPPMTDHPEERYPFYARDRRMASVVRRRGGRILLSGVGPDHYLAGNLYFFADQLARGRARESLGEMARWAALGRISFWRFLFENGVYPLMPAVLRLAVAPREKQLPDWLAPELIRNHDPRDHLPAITAFRARAGEKFQGHTRSQLAHLRACIDRGPFEEGLEMRYPFLHRPLVEFSLRLPRPLLRQPFTGKWILREAARDVLPPNVRTRRGKGSIQGRIVWSLSHERARVEALLKDSCLAEMGCVREDLLREACRSTRDGNVRRTSVMAALSLETWLRVRSGRWTARGEVRTRADPGEQFRSHILVPHS